MQRKCHFRIGLSYFDTRDLGPWSKPKKTAGKAKEENDPTPALAPGDRGSNWFKSIRSRHFRINENRHDLDRCKNHWHKGEAGCFAFGIPIFINKADIPRAMRDWFEMIHKLNIRPPEIEQHVVLCASYTWMEQRLTAKFFLVGLKVSGNRISNQRTGNTKQVMESISTKSSSVITKCMVVKER